MRGQRRAAEECRSRRGAFGGDGRGEGEEQLATSAPLAEGLEGRPSPASPTTAIIEINYLFKIEGVRVLFARDKVCSALYRNKFLRVLLGEGDIYQCKYKSLPWSSGS